MAEPLRLDGRALRVLAHPLRARLLSELRMHGAATATVLAGRLRTNTGATSYHLRKLAEVGLVVETGQSPGRQRHWAAAQESHSWSETDVEDDPDARAAAGWLRRHYWHQHVERVARWDEVRDGWPVSWQTAAGTSDAILELGAAELTDLMTDLTDVLDRHRRRAAAAPAEDRRQIVVHLQAIPTDLSFDDPDRPGR